MSIDLTALRTFIKANETLSQWGVVEGNTGKVQQWFAAAHESEKKYRSTFINERTVLAAFANPADGEALLQKLEAAGEVSAVIKRILRWMKPAEGGIDIGHASTRAMIAQLVQGNVITQTEADTLTGLAAESKTRGEVEFGVTPTIRDVDTALKLDRTDGRVGGN